MESLQEVAEALKRPQFTLYLGRKSCPLSLPPDPIIASAETLRLAFDAYDAFRDNHRPGCFDWRDPDGELALAPAFRAPPGPATYAGARVEQRRDSVVDRKS